MQLMFMNFRIFKIMERAWSQNGMGCPGPGYSYPGLDFPLNSVKMQQFDQD